MITNFLRNILGAASFPRKVVDYSLPSPQKPKVLETGKFSRKLDHRLIKPFIRPIDKD